MRLFFKVYILECLALAALAALFWAFSMIVPASAADLPTKAAPAGFQAYPSQHCGMYYGVGTFGSTGSVENAAVGTQMTQAALGAVVGYTCPVGAGYWFVDGIGAFSNFNGSTNGFSLNGPASFKERFGVGAPVNLIISQIPGLSSLQNALPSLLPLPAGVTVVTSNPYIFASFDQDDVGTNFIVNGASVGSNREWLLSAGFGIGNKIRLTNGVVFDPFVEYSIPSSKVCVGIVAGPGTLCSQVSNKLTVGALIEF